MERPMVTWPRRWRSGTMNGLSQDEVTLMTGATTQEKGPIPPVLPSKLGPQGALSAGIGDPELPGPGQVDMTSQAKQRCHRGNKPGTHQPRQVDMTSQST